MLFINYPKCSTCQKAKKWLQEKGLKFEDRNIKEENPTAEELKKFAEAGNIPVNRFFNTSGLVYKSLNLKDKLADMSEDEKFDLLATDGMLVKRPIVFTGKTTLVGFKEAEWEKTLL